MITIPVVNNEIAITKEEWLNLNAEYTQTEIIKAISDTMENLDLPLKPINEKDALDDFETLKRFDASSLIQKGTLFTKREYKWKMTDTYIDMSNVGNLSSNFFHQEARFHCDSLNAPSPYRVWTTEKFRMNMLKNLWTMPTTVVDSNRLRQAMNLRNYIASQFKPSAAKALYTYFDSKNVLDFCAGWGDRLAGFSACSNTVSYTGVDPNERLHPNYSAQIEFYNTGKTYALHEACAEDMVYTTTFDTVFTSPPYLDIERYTQENNQSWKKYKYSKAKGSSNWQNEFLHTAISRVWDALEPNGVLAVNIADVYGHHVWNQLCDPMNDFIATLPNAEYQGGIGYRMAKRPNSLVDEWKLEGKTEKPDIGKVYVEPIWVWRKK